VSKHKKRVNLSQAPSVPATDEEVPVAPAAPDAQRDAPAPNAVTSFHLNDEPGRTEGDGQASPASIERHPLFWFVLGALTVGIIVLLGLMLLNAGAASLSPLATPGQRSAATAAAAAPNSLLPTPTKPIVRAATAATAANAPATPTEPDFSAVMTAVAVEHETVARITVTETKKMLDAGTAILVDVRSSSAYTEQHARGAVNVPQSDSTVELLTLPKDKTIILYCT